MLRQKIEVFKTWPVGNPHLGHWDVFNPMVGRVMCFETFDDALNYVRELIG